MKIPFSPPTHTLEQVLGSNPAIIRGYAQGVHKALEKGPLNLMERDRLINRGERLGLKRFDANLIVATVEHQNRGQSSMRLYKEESIQPVIFAKKWLPWAIAVGVQSLIVTGAWWLIFA